MYNINNNRYLRIRHASSILEKQTPNIMKVTMRNVVGRRAYIRVTEGCNHQKDFAAEVSSDEVFGHEFECDLCKQLFIPNVYGRRYDTPSGELGPGDMYWNDWYPKDMFWDNKEDHHLCVVLPNGDHWNIDSRASNCTLPNDKTHRCWIREGTPPSITVGKAGHTCSAGAGSIACGSYHGFLRDGVLVSC